MFVKGILSNDVLGWILSLELLLLLLLLSCVLSLLLILLLKALAVTTIECEHIVICCCIEVEDLFVEFEELFGEEECDSRCE